MKTKIIIRVLTKIHNQCKESRTNGDASAASFCKSLECMITNLSSNGNADEEHSEEYLHSLLLSALSVPTGYHDNSQLADPRRLPAIPH